jgi:hypothetical protein
VPGVQASSAATCCAGLGECKKRTTIANFSDLTGDLFHVSLQAGPTEAIVALFAGFAPKPTDLSPIQFGKQQWDNSIEVWDDFLSITPQLRVVSSGSSVPDSGSTAGVLCLATPVLLLIARKCKHAW